MNTTVYKKDNKKLYTLIPVEDFKAVLSIDDRDDLLCRFCLVTATFTIEQYCRRHLIQKKYFENIEFYGDLILPLKKYPVRDVLAVFTLGNGNIVEPDFYSVVPDGNSLEDIPYYLSLSPAIGRMRNLKDLKVIYRAGYVTGKIPLDLASACMELAAWNMSRYKGRKIGMTGIVRGQGKDSEHLEMSMPENVCSLLEPYRRKLI